MENKVLSSLLVLVFLALASCGSGDDAHEFSSGEHTNGDRPIARGDRIPIGEIHPPEGETSFDLIAPPLPSGATAVPMQARLSNGTTAVTISSVNVDANGTWDGTPVEAGTYTLTWLNERGGETAFKRTVTIKEQETRYLHVGAVWVHPESSGFPEATTTIALEYRIADHTDTTKTLKTIRAEWNHVIHLPPDPWKWFGYGEDGVSLEPLQFDAGKDILGFRWGSIFLQSDIQAQLHARSGSVILYAPMLHGAEYLLPVSPQTEGCYVYQIVTGTQDKPQMQNIQLCSDANRNFAR